MWEVSLVASLSMVFFAYLGYPLTLAFIGWFRGKPVSNAPILPRVSFIIAVHNEETRIESKINNTLALDYPKEALEILVASDGSTDRTETIVRQWAVQGVRLVKLPSRQGKEAAQIAAIATATGEILVFSDVATVLNSAGLRQLVSSFADPSVGCVSSEDRLIGKDGKPSGEGLYVRYEMWLRRLESKVHSLVGLSGSLFAARKAVCQDFAPNLPSDFRTVLSSVRMGLRGVSDPLAIGLYQDLADPRREWERKVRTVVRGITVFFSHLELLNVGMYGLFSYSFVCHKLMRWLVPLFLIVAMTSNAILAFSSNVYAGLLLAHVSLYFVGIAGLITERMNTIGAIRIVSYFVSVNYSILVAWVRYLRGERIVSWVPTVR